MVLLGLLGLFDQVQAIESPKQIYTSTMNGLISIAQTHGARHLFAGLSINYIKVKLQLIGVDEQVSVGNNY